MRLTATALSAACLLLAVRGHELTAQQGSGSTVRIDSTTIRLLPVHLPAPDLTLGQRDTTFGNVTSVGADSTGMIFVLDSRASTVRVFDRDGRFVQSIGRRGSGPGEFTGGSSLVVTDSLVYIEATGIHAFRRTGEYLWSNRRFALWGVPVVGELGDGLVLWKTEGRDRLERADDLRKAVYVWKPTPDSTAAMTPVLRSVQRHYYYDDAFSWPIVLSNRQMVASSKRQGVYQTVGDSFHISVMSSDGRQERHYVGTLPRVRTTDADLADFRQTIVTQLERRNAPMRPPPFRGNGPVAEYRPAIGALVVSDDGRFLVRRTDLSDRPYDEFSPGLYAEWQLFAVSGTPLYRFRLPSHVNIRSMEGCAFYSTIVNEAASPMVQRYSIPTASCGADGP